MANPFLPLNEYVPDGEPHVFGERVYLYGSHDREGGKRFCERDYVVYSAPVTDLENWIYHGVSYKKSQDKRSIDGKPPDGSAVRRKFYLCRPFLRRIARTSYGLSQVIRSAPISMHIFTSSSLSAQ